MFQIIFGCRSYKHFGLFEQKKIINQNAAHLHREEAAVTNSLLSSTEFPPERRLCIAKSDLCPKQLLREEWQGRMQMKWGRAI